MSKYRTWVNNNSAVITVIAVVALILALFRMYWRASPTIERPQTPDVYFYDLGSTAANPIDRLFVARDQLPPIPAPSGKLIDDVPTGVRAWVYACGSCDDKSKYFIGYMEMYSTEAREAMENAVKASRAGNATPPVTGAPPGAGLSASQEGHLVSLDGKVWMTDTGENSDKITAAITGKCPDGGAHKPVPCGPPSPVSAQPSR